MKSRKKFPLLYNMNSSFVNSKLNVFFFVANLKRTLGSPVRIG